MARFFRLRSAAPWSRWVLCHLIEQALEQNRVGIRCRFRLFGSNRPSHCSHVNSVRVSICPLNPPVSITRLLGCLEPSAVSWGHGGGLPMSEPGAAGLVAPAFDPEFLSAGAAIEPLKRKPFVLPAAGAVLAAGDPIVSCATHGSPLACAGDRPRLRPLLRRSGIGPSRENPGVVRWIRIPWG